MSQVFDVVGGVTIVRSDIEIPADQAGTDLPRVVITVENFIEGDNIDVIKYVLDDRLRDRAIQSLIEKADENSNYVTISGSISKSGKEYRDYGYHIRANDYPIYVVMHHITYRPKSVPDVIDTEFRELQ